MNFVRSLVEDVMWATAKYAQGCGHHIVKFRFC